MSISLKKKKQSLIWQFVKFSKAMSISHDRTIDQIWIYQYAKNTNTNVNKVMDVKGLMCQFHYARVDFT